ncbi:4-hydroxy-tetrahydrodipicolinate reductase [Clostridiaceae bacterium M8S5]|nr:4-hydroxy-tetrahydrodipicolinate reductase [Clostridiaceae bacterium M8S5]
MIRVAINGFAGKMGQVVYQKLKSYKDIIIIAGIDRNNNLIHHNEIPVYTQVDDIIDGIDVIIDFSSRECLKELIAYGVENSVGLVIATTGLTNEDKLEIHEASKHIPIFKASNTSTGVNILLEVLKTTVRALSDSFDIEIVEKHHNQKLDAPSGTAFMLANQINSTLDDTMELVYGREGNNAKRNAKEIGIHAVRGGTIAGEHTVIFAGEDEILEFKHIALSKKIFASGAIDAARFIATKQNGLYDMRDVLNYKREGEM